MSRERRGCSSGFSQLMRACMWPLHHRLRCLKMAPSSGASPAPPLVSVQLQVWGWAEYSKLTGFKGQLSFQTWTRIGCTKDPIDGDKHPMNGDQHRDAMLLPHAMQPFTGFAAQTSHAACGSRAAVYESCIHCAASWPGRNLGMLQVQK